MWSRRNKLIVGGLAILVLILSCVCGLVFGSNIVQTPTPLPIRVTEILIVASETPTIEPSLTSTLVPTWTNAPTATFVPTSTFVPIVEPTKEVVPTKKVAPTEVKSKCDPSYPTVCIPPKPPDLNCGDIPYKNFKVLPPDPHNFDGNHDGVGCET